MKIQIVHDRSGSILAALARAEGERQGFLLPADEAQMVAEVDAAEITMSDDELRGNVPSRVLADLVDHYRFGDGRLVRRDEPWAS